MRCLPRGIDAVQLGEVAEVVQGGQSLVKAAIAAEDVADVGAHPARVLHDVVSEHRALPTSGSEA